MPPQALSLHGSLAGPAFARAGWAKLFDLFPSPAAPVTAVPMPAQGPSGLHTLLSAAFNAAGFPPGALLRPANLFDDSRYYLPTATELATLIARRPTRCLGSEVDLFDCEDFAYTFRGYCAEHHFRSRRRTDTLPFAIGMLWGWGFASLPPLLHAINFAVLNDHSVCLVDTCPGGLGLKPVPLAPAVARQLLYAVI